MQDDPEGRPHPPSLSQLFIIIYYELIKGLIKCKTQRGFGSSTSLARGLPLGKRRWKDAGK